MARLWLAVLLAIGVLLPPTTAPVTADTGDRTLYLYHTHTHETARITFKRNGVYDPKGLAQLDWFLRDFRNNQPTEMSPQLFDLVWEIYQKLGATQPINIVSAYRSPDTNAYLRSHSNGVANNSQHMLGHAMDWFVPGVPLIRLRAVAMQQQVGGVGFYPTSGSPFVHTDVGPVRAWPRMTEAQLQQLFPDGKTLHVPDDGHVLSQQGYAYAQAQWDQCHAVPCTNAAALRGGAQSLGKADMMAVAETSMTGKTFDDIHRGINPGAPNLRDPGGITEVANADDQQESLDDQADPAGPAETAVATVSVKAPIPLNRPPGLGETMIADASPLPVVAPGAAVTLAKAAAVPFNSLFPAAYDNTTTQPVSALTASVPAAAAPIPPADIPFPAEKSPDLMVATGEAPTPLAPQPQNALGAIASIEAPDPKPRLLMTRPPVPIPDSLSAYAPLGPGSAGERQLQDIIESETASAAPTTGTALTNSVGTPLGADALKSYAAQRRGGPAVTTVAAVAPNTSFTARPTRLIAPGFSSNLVTPTTMTSAQFATFSVPEADDLNPATELGPMVTRVAFRVDPSVTLSFGRFVQGATSMLVAWR